MKRKIFIFGLLIFIIGLIIGSYFIFFISKNKIIVVGTETFPFEYYNENRKLIGIDIDFLASIFKKLGLEYEVRLMDWNDALIEMKNGKADILLGAAYDKKREPFISYREEHKIFNNNGTIPKDSLWISVESFFYREGDEYNLTSYEIIKKNEYRIGIVNGYNYFNKFFDNKLNFYAYPSTERLIHGLDDGEIDLLVMDVFELNSLVKKVNLKNNIIRSDLNSNIGANFILFSKKYDNKKNIKTKKDFYIELIRLKEEENLHEILYKKYTGKTFSETYGNLMQ